jgi:hypothetical protein
MGVGVPAYWYSYPASCFSPAPPRTNALIHGHAEKAPDEMMLKPTDDRDCVKTQTDATALRRGDSRSRLQKMSEGFADATALCRGGSRLSLNPGR